MSADPTQASRPIKVLHLIKTLGLGGAETNLLNLIGSFDATRIETHVAYSFGGEIEPRFRAAGARLFKYADRSHKVKSPHSLLIVLRLARYIRRHRIDVVQTHNFNAHIWGVLAARLAGARLVEHVHDFRYTPTDDLIRRHGFFGQYRFIRYFKGRSDRIVVLTDEHRDYVIANGYGDAERVAKIQNGITFADLPRALGDRVRFGIPASATVILASARMDPSKNIELIVRIAGEVVRRAPNVLFIIAGSGSHFDEYKTLADELGVGASIRFLGFHQDMYELLALADVFVLPSFLELHSIAILEATKMGVPIVVSKHVGCNDEFVQDGVSGFLCDPFDGRCWIERLVALAVDPALRARVGAAGLATCRERFDLPSTAKRFERLYETLST